MIKYIRNGLMATCSYNALYWHEESTKRYRPDKPKPTPSWYGASINYDTSCR